MTPSPPDHDANATEDDEADRGSIAIDPASRPEEVEVSPADGVGVATDPTVDTDWVGAMILIVLGAVMVASVEHGAAEFARWAGAAFVVYGVIDLVRILYLLTDYDLGE